MRGDPGFFGTLFGIGKRIVRGGVGLATGGIGGAIASQFTPSQRATQRGRQSFVAPRQPQRVVPVPGVRGRIERVLPGGRTGFQVEEGFAPRRRRMNAGNAKALRRAVRRTDAFVRLSKSALKNTGFKIVSKSSGKVSRATMDKAVAAAHHAK